MEKGVLTEGLAFWGSPSGLQSWEEPPRRLVWEREEGGRAPDWQRLFLFTGTEGTGC